MPNPTAEITTLFTDIGGVLLTNGWDRQARRLAAQEFDLDAAEVDERHHLTFDTYEEGKLSLDEYLVRVIFYQERPFTPEAFKAFMFARSQPYTQMLDFMRTLKARQGLKIVAVSNEGRELTVHRVQTFHLADFIDIFIASSFVHIRKPDHDIYRMALDMAQVQPEQVVYIDDRAMFVEVARSLGIRAIQHTGYASTQAALADLAIPVA